MDSTIDKVYPVNFNGFRYAVREKDIIQHFIPIDIMLLPSTPGDRNIFVTTLDDDIFYLYDVTRFLGGKSGDFESARHVFIVSETDKVHGFFINQISGGPLVPELILPLPEYIRSPFLDSIAIIEGKALPLLNILELHGRMLIEETPDPGISCEIESSGKRNVTGADIYYCFSHDHRPFCVPGFSLTEMEIIKADIAPVFFYPEQFAGLACYKESIIPVICLFGGREDEERDGHIVVSGAGNMHVGLIADAKEGEVDRARMPVRELPPVARSEGWSHALVGDGKIYPLVDLYGLIDDPGKKKAGGGFKDLYIPSSDFPSLFLNEVVDIMEFEFRGNCYGLPREEVIECFSYKEYCRFPGLPVMMPGLLFYNDELLPVLDLALWSGEGSGSAGYRDMLFFVNGN
jgi:chemotaxis signal transduction protein